MNQRTRVAVCLAGATLIAPVYMLTAHAASRTVGATITVCATGADYQTISAAVTAASSGDTIDVCAGTYNETVNVTIPGLTFVGAYAGTPGPSWAGKPHSTTVDNVNGDFILSADADNTTIDGFALIGAGNATVNAYGISAFAGSSGLIVEDNVIRANGEGMNFQNPDPDSDAPALITGNSFNNNNSEGVGNGGTGTGVFISNGPANNTVISHNTFRADSQTAINFAGAGGDPSTNLVVEDNLSINDSTFVVATNSTNAVIEYNTIKALGPVPGGHGTGLLDFGENTGLRISHNSLNATAVSGTHGISLQSYAGAPSTDTTVTDNRVTGYGIGIGDSDDYTSLYIAGNTVTKSGAAGIDVTGSGNAITHNTVSAVASGGVDCEDASTGDASDGTANSWIDDIGHDGNSTPGGICPA